MKGYVFLGFLFSSIYYSIKAVFHFISYLVYKFIELDSDNPEQQQLNENEREILLKKKKALEGVFEIKEKLLPAVLSGSNTAERKENSKKIIALLDDIERSGQKDALENFDDLKKRFELIIKTADAVDFLDNADKKYFLNDNKNEIQLLLEALFIFKKNKITTDDLRYLGYKSEITEQLWTIKYINERLINAGYTDHDIISRMS